MNLGVNIDHVATVRQARLAERPSPLEAALLAEVRAFNRRYQARGLCLLPLRITKGKALLYLLG